MCARCDGGEQSSWTKMVEREERKRYEVGLLRLGVEVSLGRLSFLSMRYTTKASPERCVPCQECWQALDMSLSD